MATHRCKHICKPLQAHPQTKALSKSLQSRPRRKRNFKKCPTARQKTMKNEATNRPTNHGIQGSTGGNSTYKKMAIQWLHEVLYFVSSSVLGRQFSASKSPLF